MSHANHTVDSRRHSSGPAAHAPIRLSTLEIAALILVAIAVIAAAVVPALLGDVANPSDTTSIKVGEHDTLWEIAAAHPIEGCTTAQTVRVILELNDKSESVIIPGELIVVPTDARSTTILASK